MKTDLRIASPCSANWDLMVGNDRVRYCADCKLNVYNFSVMSQSEIDFLVRNKQGRLCARFFQRRDGRVLTQDCPVGFHSRIKRISKIAGTALFAAMNFTPAIAQNGSQPAFQEAAQTELRNSSIQLHVTDQNGVGISKADVSLINSRTQEKFTGATNENGVLLLSLLPAGLYELAINPPGFHAINRTISLKSGSIDKYDFELFSTALMGEVIPITHQSFFSKIRHKLF